MEPRGRPLTGAPARWAARCPGVPGLWDGRDIDAAYRAYFALLGRAARSGLFDIMAHPDLIKVMGHRPSPALALDALYEEAAEAFAAGGVAVEVSTAGLRKPVGEIYPDAALAEMLVDAGAAFVLSSDAHAPELVGHEYDRAVDTMRQWGIDEVATFSGRSRTMEALG